MSAEVWLIALAGAGGAWAARASGPLSCDWPAKGDMLLRRLKQVQKGRLAGTAPLAVGRALLSALFAVSALTAFAAEPSAPEAPKFVASSATPKPATPPVMVKIAPPPGARLIPVSLPIESFAPEAAQADAVSVPPSPPPAPFVPPQFDASSIADEDRPAVQLLNTYCLSCHDPRTVTSLRLDRAGWLSILDGGGMAYNANLRPEDEATIVSYLAKTYGPVAGAASAGGPN